eukprot:8657804-Pyramimonas_sp.AAC.1
MEQAKALFASLSHVNSGATRPALARAFNVSGIAKITRPRPEPALLRHKAVLPRRQPDLQAKKPGHSHSNAWHRSPRRSSSGQNGSWP